MSKTAYRVLTAWAAEKFTAEMIAEEGLDREIIGVSRDEAFPPQTLAKPAFSYHDDVEKFIASQPDLVLVRPMISLGYPDFVKAGT